MPPLERVEVRIPLINGLGESIDSRIRPAAGEGAMLSRLDNGYYLRSGAVSKRHGFTSVENRLGDRSVDTIGTLGDVRGLFSTGDELCCIGSRRLYAYNEVRDAWFDRGSLSPCLAEADHVFFSELTFIGADMAEAGDYRIFVAERLFYDNSTSNYSWGMRVAGSTTDGQTTFQETEYLTTGTLTSRPHAPRACAHNTDVVITVAIGGQAGAPAASALGHYSWNAATPHNAPVALANITADLFHESANFAITVPEGYNSIRTHSSCATPVTGYAGYYVVAYILHSTQEIVLESYNSSHVLQATTTITPPGAGEEAELFRRVDVCFDGSANIYVLAWSKNALSSNVYLYKRAALTTGAVAGPTTMRTAAANVYFDNLGVCQGNNGTENRVACSWFITPSGTGGPCTEVSSTKTDLTDVENIEQIWNHVPFTRPFWKDERCYLGLMYYSSGAAGATVYGFTAIHDVDQSGGASRRSRIVGMWDVGTSPVNSQFFLTMGNGNTVNTNGDTFTFMGQSLRSLTDSNIYPRFAGDMVKLDFAGVPLAAQVSRGSAVIGGAACFYYNGNTTVELGFPTAPLIVTHVAALGSNVGDGTYDSVAVWEYRDPKGVYHRGPPSPSVSTTTANPNNSINLTSLSYPGTHRDLYQCNCVYYRAGTSGTPLRVNEQIELHQNVDTASTLAVFNDDYTTQTTTPLYTAGGYLEAVSPEGAQVPCAVNERLWLGAAVRRERVCPSHKFTPGSSTEDALAPEFNETLAKMVPTGAKITGIAGLFDKLVVFTEFDIYLLAGDGPDTVGGGSDFSPLTPVATDAGCIEPRSVATCPLGVLFQSKAGIYIVTQQCQVAFIGKDVRDQLEAFPTVTSAVTVPKQNQVRFTCLNVAGDDAVILVYDYNAKAWSRWFVTSDVATPVLPVGACVHKDVYYIVDAAGKVYKEDSTTWLDNGDQYVSLDVELSWVQGAGQSGWMHVDRIMPLCSKQDACDVSMKVYTDFATIAQSTNTWTEAEITAMPAPALRMQLDMPVMYPECTAIKARIYDAESSGTTTGEGYDLAGFVLELGVEKGTAHVSNQEKT